MRRFFQRPASVLGLVLIWKLVLFAATQQPVPGNDSFFYDGAVVNWLESGGYRNPTLALAFPIAGGDVFAAYPPLYQALLLGWMALFGTSALSAMALHQVLFALYALALHGVLRRLAVPTRYCHLAALFLLVNTFHDRPDSLAHVLGMTMILAWVSARTSRLEHAPVVASRALGASGDRLAAVLAVLALATSLQLGALYVGCLWLMALGEAYWRKRRPAFGPLMATVLVPLALGLAIYWAAPRWWEGFLEHARETPGWTGLRVPLPVEALKVCRTVPAVGVVMLTLGWLYWRRRETLAAAMGSLPALVGLSALGGVVGIVLGGLTFLTPNLVLAAGYLQPLVVGLFPAMTGQATERASGSRTWAAVWIALALVSSVRALGMSTWGVICAADVNYTGALQQVRRALEETPPGETVAVSAAYLYEAVCHRKVHVVHSDWLAAPSRGLSRADAVVAAGPVRMILTPFDRYRFYGEALPELQQRTGEVEVRIRETGRVPVPDASPRLQRVLQHISWAPVIVELKWKPETQTR